MENKLYECEEKFQSDFDKNYNEKIKPFLQTYETKRKNILKRVKLKLFGIYLLIVIDIVFFVYTAIHTPYDPDGSKNIFAPLLALLVFCAWRVSSSADAKFVYELNAACLNDVLNIFGGIKPVETSSITDDMLKQSGAFGEYNTRNDLISFEGSLADKHYEILHTNLYHKCTAYKKDRKTSNIEGVFSGILIHIKSNKNINKTIKIAPKGTYGSFVTEQGVIMGFILCGAYAAMLSIYYVLEYKLMQELKEFLAVLSAGSFLIIILTIIITNCIIKKHSKNRLQYDNNYEIETSDSTEAFIPETFFECLDKIKTAFKTKMVKCVIFRDNILIQIPLTKRCLLFGSLFRELTKKEAVEALFKRFLSIFLTVMFIKLSNDKNPRADI